MIRTTKRNLAFAMVLLAGLGSSASAAPDDGFHYLICKGGREMNPIIQPTDNSTQIILSFYSTPFGWNKESILGTSQCTWADRKVSDDEPRTIRFDIPADVEVTKSWAPNAKAFFFPFQKPATRTVSRTTKRVAIQILRKFDGYSLKLLRPNSAPRSRSRSQREGRAYEAIATFDFTGQSYLTFSVQAVDGVFVANRIIKGAVTGDQINIDDGGQVIISPSPRER